MSELLATEVFHEAQEGISVRQPPVDAVVARAKAARRRRRGWAAGVTAGIVAVVAVGTWIGTRPEDAALPDPVVKPEQNPANIEWYANGVLHLDDLTVDLPSIESMVQLGDGGVVYGDEDGQVIHVRSDGSLEALGHQEPGAPLASSVERGWVAWVDPHDGSPELIVHSTLTGKEVARTRLASQGDEGEEPGASYPVAIDQAVVYYSAPDGDWAWEPPDGHPNAVVGGELLDVASAVRVIQAEDGFLNVIQPLFDIEIGVPGDGAMLSEDGNYVLTRVDTPVPGTVGIFNTRVRIYDTRSGEQVGTGLGPDDSAAVATFGPDETVTYIVRGRSNAASSDPGIRLSTSGPVFMRTCALDIQSCATPVEFAHRQIPVLPE